MLQHAVPSLSASTHDFSHGDFNIANFVVVAIAVSVDDNKAHLLLLLKVVGDCEGSAEVGIKVVLELFSLAEQDPVVVFLFKEEALWIGLANHIVVLQFAT